ncbi:pyridoxamine 5'-phosphate oxidase family protein [Streptomyces sp. NPDC127068]|uniref:pyridoxamine 5'-phosphate oxidase family protein n=1 Tax=Streptomyces sp. NPDC127068 TaxID=3347127 RepID=UPI00364A73F4
MSAPDPVPAPATVSGGDPRTPRPDDAPEFLDFWRERHIGFLSTARPDGSHHLVPVGVTYDPDAGIARVISSATSRKVRNVLAAGPGARASVGQVDGRRWSTLEGPAVVRDDPESVAEAEARYAERYRTPRVNPQRVVIEITVTRAMGSVRRTAPATPAP